MSFGPLDVIVVGAGPAGIFTCIELLERVPGIRLMLLEKGKSLETRSCPMIVAEVSCAACRECAVLCGWGGAGAYSDGKLCLSRHVGGHLTRYVGDETLDRLIDKVDGLYLRFGAPDIIHGRPDDALRQLQKRAAHCGLTLLTSPVRHIGTDICATVLDRMYDFLKDRVTIRFGCSVSQILSDHGRVTGVMLDRGEELHARFVVLAPGREGAKWLDGEACRLGLTRLTNPVDIGVRVELGAHILDPLTRVTYEPKMLYRSRRFNDQIRTFCVNPYGEVVKEHLEDIWTVNGHSFASRTSENTNFALLVSTTFTEPFDEPIRYGRHIAQLANFLGRGVLVQRLGDLMLGRRSTPDRIAAGGVVPTLKDATPGDLSFVLPFRYLANIMEMLEAMDRLSPGVNHPDTLLYGVEVKFYSRLFKLTPSLETELGNMFAAGDGAGVSRGLVQASASGLVVADEICSRSGL